MQFEWNIKKNLLNMKKHGLSFEIARYIFEDPFILSVPDNRFNYEEERWQSIGLIKNVIIYMAHTIGEDENGEEIIRIISARQATTTEAKKYYYYRQHAKRT